MMRYVRYISQSFARPLLLLAVVLSVSLSLFIPQRTAHAAGVIQVTIVDARTGLLRIHGEGYVPNQPVLLEAIGSTVARPNTFIHYLKAVSTLTGSFDLDFPLGEFLCGSYIKLIVNGNFGILAESPTVLGECPVPTPSIAITGIKDGFVQIEGDGFDIAETVGISATSLLTGLITGTVVLSDAGGTHSGSVPAIFFSCGEYLQALAIGKAGSNVTSVPFLYSCPLPSSVSSDAVLSSAGEVTPARRSRIPDIRSLSSAHTYDVHSPKTHVRRIF